MRCEGVCTIHGEVANTDIYLQKIILSVNKLNEIVGVSNSEASATKSALNTTALTPID
jgi:hypothetical protein